MKQILLFLLFPCFAMAQYPGNANQKITLGEQTTADGLVYRGNAADTVAATLKITKTNKSDTSAFLLLDTINNVFLKYNIGTTFWTRLNILPTDTATMLLPYWRSGRFSGVLPVANGGTNTSTAFTEGSVVFAGASGTSLTQDNSNFFWNNTEKRLGIGTSNPTNPLSVVTSGGSFLIASNGQFTTKQDLDVVGSGGRFTAQSTRGTLGRIRIAQVTTGVDGGEISFDTSPSGSTTPSERLRIYNNGDVHIGDYSFDSRFVIKHNANNREAFNINYSNANVSMFQIYQYTTDTEFNLRNSSAVPKFRLSTNGDSFLNGGNVGIGTTSPQSGYRLHVVDSVYVGGNVSASAYTTRSDYELKDEIQNISYGINEVMQMQPVKYTYKSNGSTQLGFIAQDLGVITPEVVSFEDKMSVYYNALIPILTKAIQEQQALIKALEQRILTLENK